MMKIACLLAAAALTLPAMAASTIYISTNDKSQAKKVSWAVGIMEIVTARGIDETAPDWIRLLGEQRIERIVMARAIVEGVTDMGGIPDQAQLIAALESGSGIAKVTRAADCASDWAALLSLANTACAIAGTTPVSLTLAAEARKFTCLPSSAPGLNGKIVWGLEVCQ